MSRQSAKDEQGEICHVQATSDLSPTAPLSRLQMPAKNFFAYIILLRRKFFSAFVESPCMRCNTTSSIVRQFISRLQVQVAASRLSHRSTSSLYKIWPAPISRSFTHHTSSNKRSPPSMDSKELSHTQSLAELATLLKGIGLEEVPKEPDTYPAINPVDIYRSHISELLAPIAGVEKKIVYQALQYANTLDKGDLVLAVPALRLKGKKPDELAIELASKVC